MLSALPSLRPNQPLPVTWPQWLDAKKADNQLFPGRQVAIATPNSHVRIGIPTSEGLEEKKFTEETFPATVQCHRYALISRYPGACKQGMSIKSESSKMTSINVYTGHGCTS